MYAERRCRQSVCRRISRAVDNIPSSGHWHGDYDGASMACSSSGAAQYPLLIRSATTYLHPLRVRA